MFPQDSLGFDKGFSWNSLENLPTFSQKILRKSFQNPPGPIPKPLLENKILIEFIIDFFNGFLNENASQNPPQTLPKYHIFRSFLLSGRSQHRSPQNPPFQLPFWRLSKLLGPHFGSTFPPKSIKKSMKNSIIYLLGFLLILRTKMTSETLPKPSQNQLKNRS